jgi:hypothetical protein
MYLVAIRKFVYLSRDIIKRTGYTENRIILSYVCTLFVFYENSALNTIAKQHLIALKNAVKRGEEISL